MVVRIEPVSRTRRRSSCRAHAPDRARRHEIDERSAGARLLRMLGRLKFIVLLVLLAVYDAPGQTHLRQLYESAEKLVEQGHDDEARTRFKDLLVSLHRDRAVLFREQGQWKAARSELEAAWGLNRNAPGLRSDLAFARHQAGTVRSSASGSALSAQERERLANDAKILARAYDRLALIAVRHSDFTEAAKCFRRLQAFEPSFPNVDLNLCLALYR